MLTSLGGNTSIPEGILEFTASSFIDKNCDIKVKFKENYKAYIFSKECHHNSHLYLPLKRLDIINYLIKNQRFPNNLSQRNRFRI